MNDWREGITGERTNRQVVDGPRRLPVYNKAALNSTRHTPMVEKISPPQAAAALPPKTSPKTGTDYNAYDRFDDEGNEIVPAPHALAEEEDAIGAGAIDNVIHAFKSPAETAPSGPRKSLSGNPNYSRQTESVAPLPPGPQTDLKSDAPMVIIAEPVATPAIAPTSEKLLAQASLPPEPAVKTTPAPADTQWTPQTPPPVLEKPASDTAEEKTAEEHSGFLARIGDTLKRPFAKESTPVDPAAEALPYPALSGVPATPPALSTVKNQKQENLEQLQSDHELAEQGRQEIASEPSEFAPAAIVPASTPANAVKAPTTESFTEEIIAVPVTPTSAKKSSWFDRINVFNKQEEKTDPAQESGSIPVTPATAFTAPLTPAQLVETPGDTTQPLLVEPAPQPLRSASGEELPSLRASGAPVAPVVAADEEGEAAPGGLPSAQPMQKTRLLAPSRYNTRSGAAHSQ